MVAVKGRAERGIGRRGRGAGPLPCWQEQSTACSTSFTLPDLRRRAGTSTFHSSQSKATVCSSAASETSFVAGLHKTSAIFHLQSTSSSALNLLTLDQASCCPQRCHRPQPPPIATGRAASASRQLTLLAALRPAGHQVFSKSRSGLPIMVARGLVHRGLAWLFLILAFCGWAILLGGLAALQEVRSTRPGGLPHARSCLQWMQFAWGQHGGHAMLQRYRCQPPANRAGALLPPTAAACPPSWPHRPASTHSVQAVRPRRPATRLGWARWRK